VYDFDARDERPYIVMAHMPGGSLWDRMQAGERSDPEPLAFDFLTGLEAIHSARIIHRDIKPGNILFAADGTACLTDFGVARPEDATSLTQTGQIPGTANFMAPELWAGEPADERSDLFAAGVVLRDAIGNDASPELHALVDRLTASNREDRPASAGAALDELRHDGSARIPSVTAAAGEPTPRTIIIQSDSRSRRRAAIAGVAVLAVVAAIAIAQAVGGGGDDPGGGSSDGSNQSADGSRAKKSGSGSDNGESAGGGGNEAQASTGAPTVDPIALDQEGKALIDAGKPKEAIPILQQAVDYYPEDSRDINYAYSLYNLGDALLLAGRPDEAIPYFEKRLTWDDQKSTVEAKLDEARAAAGEGSGGESNPNGKVPPGQAKQED
jgi:tetratricopeptide (TPR) repeat protein